MPEDETVKNAKPKTKPEVLGETVKPEPCSEPYLKKQVLAPNSPWKVLQADESIITYIFEIARVGVLIRTESPAAQSESMVFIPNIKPSDLPNCE